MRATTSARTGRGSGLAHALVPPGQLPPAPRSAMGDHMTGLALAAGIVAKLLARERTGEGGLVATSLLRIGMYTLAWDIGIRLRFGKLESTRSREVNKAPLLNCYQSSDGRGFWLLLLEADRHWPKLIAALGRDDLAADPRFADAAHPAGPRHRARRRARRGVRGGAVRVVDRSVRRARRVVGTDQRDRRRDRGPAGHRRRRLRRDDAA